MKMSYRVPRSRTTYPMFRNMAAKATTRRQRRGPPHESRSAAQPHSPASITTGSCSCRRFQYSTTRRRLPNPEPSRGRGPSPPAPGGAHDSNPLTPHWRFLPCLLRFRFDGNRRPFLSSSRPVVRTFPLICERDL